MKFVQAQFSLKYEPRWKIRRDANHIEDLLQEYYGTPQIMPLPDDIAAEAPRIVFASHGGHSQINFSQISADFTVGLMVILWSTMNILSHIFKSGFNY